jgi:AcrR family transcriptional regulator
MVSAADERTARRRESIIDAARTVFLDKGFAGANMDEVVTLASASKRTVYGHFRDKEGLFAAVITSDIRAAERQSQDIVEALAVTDDLETDLRAFAREHIAIVTQPHLLRLRRLVIGEAERFPALAREWHARGPGRGHETFARVFSALADRGLLVVPDPLVAAQHFNWLILSIPLNTAMFRPSEQFSTEELNHWADEGVRVFLAAYRR